MDPANPMPLSCPDCAAQMPETAAFCPGCGRSMAVAVETVPAETTGIQTMPVATRATGNVGFLPENIAGALAYLSFVPAIVFLVREPYNRNQFVRFHAVQCLLLWATGLLTAAALKLAAMVLFIIPVAGPLFAVLILALAGFAAFVSWLVLLVKALQGEMFKLPMLGDFAEQHSISH